MGNRVPKGDLKTYFEVYTKPLENGCIVWTGGCLNTGRGWASTYRKIASVLAYEYFVGPVVGLVLHKCREPNCVNPAHLYLGNHKQNAWDRDKRDFTTYRPYRRYNPHAKLSEEQVDEILRFEGSHVKTAKKLGVSKSLVHKIRSDFIGRSNGTC